MVIGACVSSITRSITQTRDVFCTWRHADTLLMAGALSSSLSHSHICPQIIRHSPGEGAQSRMKTLSHSISCRLPGWCRKWFFPCMYRWMMLSLQYFSLWNWSNSNIFFGPISLIYLLVSFTLIYKSISPKWKWHWRKKAKINSDFGLLYHLEMPTCHHFLKLLS